MGAPNKGGEAEKSPSGESLSSDAHSAVSEDVSRPVRIEAVALSLRSATNPSDHDISPAGADVEGGMLDRAPAVSLFKLLTLRATVVDGLLMGLGTVAGVATVSRKDTLHGAHTGRVQRSWWEPLYKLHACVLVSLSGPNGASEDAI
jgi:hypothetical protein